MQPEESHTEFDWPDSRHSVPEAFQLGLELATKRAPGNTQRENVI